MAMGPGTGIERLAEALTIVRNKAACLILRMGEPRRVDNTPPRPQNSLGPSGTRIPVFTFRRGSVPDLSPFHPPRWSLLSPHYPAASYAWQLRVCGQGGGGDDGSRLPPPVGDRALSLGPIW